MGLKFIRCEDGSYVHVRNVTRLSVEVTYDDKATIKAHHNGPSMPFTIARFDTSRDAQTWLMDLVDRLEIDSGVRLPLKRPAPETRSDSR